ncbi:MAG: hypothetical protein V1824_01330 [archaeon]
MINNFLSFFSDFQFILKIFFFVAIIAFFKKRITNNILVLFLIAIASILLIFFYWPIFGTVYVFYTLLTLGISGILVDMFFVTMGESPKEAMEIKDNAHTGIEYNEQLKHQQHKQHAAHAHAAQGARRMMPGH